MEQEKLYKFSSLDNIHNKLDLCEEKKIVLNLLASSTPKSINKFNSDKTVLDLHEGELRFSNHVIQIEDAIITINTISQNMSDLASFILRIGYYSNLQLLFPIDNQMQYSAIITTPIENSKIRVTITNNFGNDIKGAKVVTDFIIDTKTLIQQFNTIFKDFLNGIRQESNEYKTILPITKTLDLYLDNPQEFHNNYKLEDYVRVFDITYKDLVGTWHKALYNNFELKPEDEEKTNISYWQKLKDENKISNFDFIEQDATSIEFIDVIKTESPHYNLNNFNCGKALIYQEQNIDGKIVIGNRICINTNGKKLFELPTPDMFCNEFEDEDVAIVYLNNKCALINNRGNFLTEFIYDFIYCGSENGLFEVKQNGLHGHIDIRGNEVIPCIYQKGHYFSEGVCPECLNDKWGLIDFNNNTIIPFKYDELGCCYNNTISAKLNDKWGLLDRKGDIVIDFIYDEIHNFTARDCLVFIAKQNNKYGLIDYYNNIIEPFIYDNSKILTDEAGIEGHYIKLQQNNKYALYSTKARMFLTGFIYDEINNNFDGNFSVQVDNQQKYINNKGEEISITKDINKPKFYCGYARVFCHEKGKYIYINKQGNELKINDSLINI